MGFNPRPPLLAGDALEGRISARFETVSIRARYCWRAMLLRKDNATCDHGFNPRPPLLAGDAIGGGAFGGDAKVSIRARHCWRAMRGYGGAGGAGAAVSIRARHCWRAMPQIHGKPMHQDPFQSAPAIAGGRCTPCRGARSCTRRFNPRPPLLAGDALAAVAAAVNDLFQSAPAIAGGRCVAAQHAHEDRAVSIRARHCWRAMQRNHPRGHAAALFQSAPAIAGGRCHHADRAPCAIDRFNPRPPLLAGDAPELVAMNKAKQFQSAPAIAGGRCIAACRFATIGRMFQSAPAIAGGRCADAQREVRGDEPVSIRARHCWRAMRTADSGSFCKPEFQSAPAIAGGRCNAAAGLARPDRCFNPRPPLLAGDASAARARTRAPARFNPRPPLLAGDAIEDDYAIRVKLVSIRARHCWRAMPTTSSCSTPGFAFQSAPAIAGGRCMAAASMAARSLTFQSAPAIAGGRCH